MKINVLTVMNVFAFVFQFVGIKDYIIIEALLNMVDPCKIKMWHDWSLYVSSTNYISFSINQFVLLKIRAFNELVELECLTILELMSTSKTK